MLITFTVCGTGLHPNVRTLFSYVGQVTPLYMFHLIHLATLNRFLVQCKYGRQDKSTGARPNKSSVLPRSPHHIDAPLSCSSTVRPTPTHHATHSGNGGRVVPGFPEPG